MYTLEDFDRFIRQNADEKYKAFISKIINTRYPLNGVRMPLLKAEAKKIACDSVSEDFFDRHATCYEQVALEGLVLARKAKGGEFFSLLEKYVVKIDDWSLCDSACCAAKRRDEEYYAVCASYVRSDDEWRARWGIVAVMVNFLDKSESELVSLLAQVKQGRYYSDMALAWLLQVLAAQDKEKAASVIKVLPLSLTVRKMTVGKIRDSFRIDKENKASFKKMLLGE